MRERKAIRKSTVKDKHRKGKVTVVGIGPGSIDHMTNRAIHEIRSADSIVGFGFYIQQVRSLIRPSAKVYSSGMGHEIDRASLALELAANGKKVTVVSGGDPGVYGMAGPIIETANKQDMNVDVVVIPGVTAATASAASLGAPLMTDFAVISLSDLLVPRNRILERVKVALKGDFVLVLYNPRSRDRREPLRLVHEMLMKYRKPTTPVGIVTAYSRRGETTIVTTLKRMLDYEIDMTSTILVGNSLTRIFKEKILTPRGYYKPKSPRKH
jgi:precorrin-3B C17-methyltransferase